MAGISCQLCFAENMLLVTVLLKEYYLVQGRITYISQSSRTGLAILQKLREHMCETTRQSGFVDLMSDSNENATKTTTHKKSKI